MEPNRQPQIHPPYVPSRTLAYFINEREAIRIARSKTVTTDPTNWTRDPIFQRYKFCNIRREDDAVTRWLTERWYPYCDSPNYTRAMVLARLINWPPSLHAIGFPLGWSNPHIINALKRREANGHKVFNSAYVVSTNGIAMDKIAYVVAEVAASVPADHQIAEETLAEYAAYLCQCHGIGTFMAGQVIADLKNTPNHRLQDAPDWWTWASPGPGSKRGLLWYHRAKVEFDEGLKLIIKEVTPLLEDYIPKLCAQNWQNILCEYDKYMRTKYGNGRPKQYYRPNPKFP